jgi:hypothetical protein
MRFHVTLAAIPLLHCLDRVNLVMLFLLAVVGMAARYDELPEPTGSPARPARRVVYKNFINLSAFFIPY